MGNATCNCSRGFDVLAERRNECFGGSARDPDEIMKFLSQVKLFKRLPQNLHGTLAAACEDVEFRPNSVIIRQGDEGNEFFVIKQGSASVTIDGQPVATLKVGDHFGERALLCDELRNATITANADLEAIKIRREQFEKLGLREKLEFPIRKAVGGGGHQEIVVKAPSPKRPEERQLMANALEKNNKLNSIVNLKDERIIQELIEVAWKEEVKKGTTLIEEGDMSANYFYIVQQGSFVVSSATGNFKQFSIGPESSFGELALLYLAPRAATVKASDDAVVWVIDRGNFKRVLTKQSNHELEYVKYLDKVEILTPLHRDEKEAVAKCLTEMTFKKDETILQQGEKGEVFYILTQGEVSVLKDKKPTAMLIATPEKAAFFGERALLTNESRSATVKVVSKEARALMLDRQSFVMLLGPLEELKKRGKHGKSMLQDKKTQSGPDKSRFGKIIRKDLKKIGLLGSGGFGAVYLVEHAATGSTYALKELSKGYVVKAGMQQSVMSEKDVQILCDSPFIVKLYETYNSSQQLFFLLELALGGELYATYNKKGLYGKEPHAKFYVAGVVNAFDHMHGKKIIFRDLKPENLLLNEHGHVKLTDMGLAKVVVGKTFTTCGTPDYFAPELIASSGHTVAVDWWTLGILAYELMVGNPPFEAEQPMLIYQKVNRGIQKSHFPPKCRGNLEDLICNLLKKDPSQRLPMRKGGSNNIKSHAWYKAFDWQKFENLKMATPYTPPVKSKKDIANFSAKEEDKPAQVTYKDDGSGWDKGFATC